MSHVAGFMSPDSYQHGDCTISVIPSLEDMCDGCSIMCCAVSCIL